MGVGRAGPGTAARPGVGLEQINRYLQKKDKTRDRGGERPASAEAPASCSRPRGRFPGALELFWVTPPGPLQQQPSDGRKETDVQITCVFPPNWLNHRRQT